MKGRTHADPYGSLNLPQTAPAVNHANHENRPNLRLLRAVDLERDRLYRALYDHARSLPEWGRFLSLPGVDRWAERLHGAAQVLAGAMHLELLREDDLRNVAGYLADRHGRMSHDTRAQRRRAYQRAAAVRERNRERDAAIRRERASGMSQRKIAALHGLALATVQDVLKRNSGKPVTKPTGLPDRTRLVKQGGVGRPRRRPAPGKAPESPGGSESERGEPAGRPPLVSGAAEHAQVDNGRAIAGGCGNETTTTTVNRRPACPAGATQLPAGGTAEAAGVPGVVLADYPAALAVSYYQSWYVPGMKVPEPCADPAEEGEAPPGERLLFREDRAMLRQAAAGMVWEMECKQQTIDGGHACAFCLRGFKLGAPLAQTTYRNCYLYAHSQCLARAPGRDPAVLPA